MTVYVKCRKCSKEQESKLIQMDSEQALRNSTFHNNYEPCRNCGAQILVDNKTLYWK